ncbi:hypothetical protein [Halobacterium jilantaiense]|uniref:Uncharacterized protein n=1 Tax=Halobacterium jilantaiense TaxID=355548 RepID=A0A1I0NCT2_9EURY|nr:hypothetical protein [Halobacterium jilantaiense]SEV98824.1 hypothetical protein SAMN04487945_0761 [Halobacterium jilantaiense]
MDAVRLGYDLVRAYVYALVLGAVATVVWFLAPELAATPQVASVWFAIAGFGLLVLVTFLLTQYSRGS